MPVNQELLEKMCTNRSRTLLDVSFEKSVFLVFLRHFGCTFCREALNDLSVLKPRIDGMNTDLIFVHMADDLTAEEYFRKYNLENSEHISDPLCQYYQAFGLVKGSFNQLLGFHNFIRGIDAGMLQGHGIGRFLGDGFQMPGLFLIQDGRVMHSFIHKYAGERPDYMDFVQCCPPMSLSPSVS
jgi:hypothetical protein